VRQNVGASGSEKERSRCQSSEVNLRRSTCRLAPDLDVEEREESHITALKIVEASHRYTTEWKSARRPSSSRDPSPRTPSRPTDSSCRPAPPRRPPSRSSIPLSRTAPHLPAVIDRCTNWRMIRLTMFESESEMRPGADEMAWIMTGPRAWTKELRSRRREREGRGG